MNRELVNVIYCTCIAQPWLEVAEQLEQQLNFRARYFLGWPDANGRLSKEDIDSRFENCFYQTTKDAWKGIGFPPLVDNAILDESLLKDVAHYELIALKMMDRMDPSGEAFPFTHRQWFFRDLLVHWLYIIDDRDISLVISPSIPHRVYDYALYVAAKVRSIKFLSFQMTPFEDATFIVDDISMVPSHIRTAHNNSSNSNLISASVLERINKVKLHYDDAKPDYMILQAQENRLSKSYFRQLLKKIKKNKIENSYVKTILKRVRLFFDLRFSYLVRAGNMPNTSRFTEIGLRLYLWRLKKNIKKYKKKYEGLVGSKIKNKFVLVALHYQPEQTTNPSGGVFVDQLLVLKLLNAFLPNDVDIVVKEHKSQFYKFLEGEAGRSFVFYKRISEIAYRVKFVSVDNDPFDLIEKAIATVTVCGTIGWESAIRGTPAIVLGSAWYEGMPKVLRIKSLRDLEAVWPKILALKGVDLDQEIISYHANLEKYLIRATHCHPFVGKSRKTNSESAKAIVDGIKSYLNSPL